MSDITTQRVSDNPWTIEELVAVARGERRVELARDRSWREKIERCAGFVERAWQENRSVYGITTGFGDSVDRPVPPELSSALQLNLTRFHGCGLGRHLDRTAARAVVAARLVSFASGYSGVSPTVMERLCDLLNHDIVPLIPEEGSVGASGDLTPLSYVAAVLFGERDVLHWGERRNAAEALAAEGLSPLEPRPKEALSLMNGTCAMTALACLAFDRASYLATLACRITALTVEGLGGNPGHFDERIFAAKPHKGQAGAARRIRGDLAAHGEEHTGRLQDPYSVRCAPHIIGVLLDALPWMRKSVETELNGANDNPLVDPATGEFLHSGNFYGGHIAFVADGLKNAVANIADLLDRQMALLVDHKSNRGLPPNLSGSAKARASINHGFKALQIAASAWTAEALKLTMPASAFSRSTECHNQDKVSMGTIAARDGLRVLELTEQVAAGMLMASVQAIDLRIRNGGLEAGRLSEAVRGTMKAVRELSPFLDEDRVLEDELRELSRAIAEKRPALC